VLVCVRGDGQGPGVAFPGDQTAAACAAGWQDQDEAFGDAVLLGDGDLLAVVDAVHGE
jgi:hypothetical protein